jgi:hypothetical protein
MVLAGCLLAAPLVYADADLETELARDVVLRALVDELDRNIGGLELEDLERPYFIEYALRDLDSAGVTAELSSVAVRNAGRSRRLRAEVRVGSYELDNTNFSRGGFGRFGLLRGAGRASIPIEDDYNAIRQAIWWQTDRAYKSVVETLAQKKAFMKSKMIEEKPPDFSRETPVVFLEARIAPQIDRDWLEMLAVRLSEVFRDHPEVLESSASVDASAGNKYLVNTEGTRIRVPGSLFVVSVSATVQADDGMELSDSFTIYARQQDDIPPLPELEQRAGQMVQQLIALKNAPRVEEAYTGPVLFDAEAAAALFSQHFGRRFAGGQRPVGSETSVDDFANKLNRRILPRFMDVVDDPLLERFEGKPLMGHFVHDDQGVPAQTTRLVENGRLKNLLMSRNPSKAFDRSNGHGRGFYSPAAGIGTVLVTADPAASEAELIEELIEAAQDEGLPYAMRIRSLGSVGGGYGGYYGSSTPLMMYRVYPDGREELVRGAQIARIDLKDFKRMLAAGDQPYALNSGSRGRGQSVVAPAMLFEELDLAKIDRDFDKPPILPAPLAREGAEPERRSR